MTLEARDISSGLSAFVEQNVNVQQGSTTISGDTYIQDKVARYYLSNVPRGYWFERYDTLGRWHGTTEGAPDTIYRRIWPRGDYAVEVRQQNSADGVLKRGLLRVQMCYNTCEQPPIELTASATSANANTSWPILGGGPVVSSGTIAQPKVVQYYNLTGNHADASPFASTAALLEVAGEVAPVGGARIRWTHMPSSTSAVHHTQYTVTPSATGTVLGMAYDFDLGANPTDDIAGFDAKRSLVYVYDKNEAVGVLIRKNGKNVINSTVQFGAKRFATGLSSTIWTSQRRSGTDLLSTADDVQLLISTLPADQQATYDVFLLKAADIAGLRQIADRLR